MMILLCRSCRSRAWNVQQRLQVQASIRSLTTTNSNNSSIQSKPDPSLVDARNAPSDFTPDCAVVYRDFLTSEEGDLLVEDILSRMKRRRYEKGHWDAVITNYKEVEMADECLDTTPEIPIIFQRVRHHLQANHLAHSATTPIPWLPCHAIDLKKEGELTAHVDSIKFSGNLVAGISLLSASIMRLVPDDGNDDDDDDDDTPTKEEKEEWVDLYLPPLSLYALTGVGRYRYSHQLLPHNSIFTTSDDGSEIVVERDHRLSVIFRDGKQG